MMDRHEKIDMKIPTFDDDKTKWRTFKAKMQSYLARNQMGVLLRWTYPTPQDAETWDATALKDPDNVNKLEVRTQNEKATAILLGSLETGTKAGDVAFLIVSKTMKPADGYVSGDFKKAWAVMLRKYEETDAVSKADLKKEYCALMMEDDSY